MIDLVKLVGDEEDQPRCMVSQAEFSFEHSRLRQGRKYDRANEDSATTTTSQVTLVLHRPGWNKLAPALEEQACELGRGLPDQNNQSIPA